MRIYAIDPGQTHSGVVILNDGSIDAAYPSVDNWLIMRELELHPGDGTVLAIETMQATYCQVAQSVIDTLIWIGEFKHAWRPRQAVLISRQRVKQLIGCSVKASDSGVRMALIERLGQPGTKRKPGPTYGVTSHAWSALAVAVAAQESVQPGSQVRIYC